MPRVVIQVIVAIDFKVIPQPIVIIINIKPVEDRIVVIIQIDSIVEEITVNIAVNIVLVEVCSQFVWEISFWTIVRIPLPNTGT